MSLSLITDAYTHEIVGYALHDTFDTAGPLRALEMVLRKFPAGTLSGLIHHSDRGAQYCSKEYVSTLQKNGILKTEWLYHEALRGPASAQKRIREDATLFPIGSASKGD